MFFKFKIATLLAAFIFCFVAANAQEEYKAEWESLNTHKAAPEWFADAKLGVYFHWGVYSVPAWGSEWYPRWMYVPDRVGWGSEIYAYHKKTYGDDVHYHDFIPQWKGEKFSAKEWVDMFENMGAKFIGSIAEHHDGFSLWESKANEWNSVAMGPGIDVVKAIGEETKKRDLKYMTTFHHGFNMMFYPKPENSYLRPVTKYQYVQDSCEVPQDEKYRKLYGNMDYDEANDLWLAKLNEVIDAYCPDYIWMDFGQRFVKESHRQQFLANYFNKAAELNKEVVVNTKGTFFPTDLAVVNVERATMEDITADVWITDFILGSSWCYNQAKRTAIDPHKAIRMLAEVVSKNGVMLLSAGPMADGTIPEEQVKAMEGIGAWMQLYGEAIYSTRPFVAFGEGTTKLVRDPADAWNEYGAIKKGLDKLNAADVRFTQNGKTVYAIQLGWPGESKETMLSTFAGKAKDLKVKSVTVLGSKERVKWKKTAEGLKVTSPKNKPAEADAALVYKITLR
ncbi:alpha-L-fucosidase [Flammeovirgaceae bacterium SG7u.111]|nr:alpha-L-fucosidase [Flammeovirgaceae bacterium SG7u.132]WPO38651.1 alpha-L-fucosidase [Flammeovirgaceae bacterium SG7u.111]